VRARLLLVSLLALATLTPPAATASSSSLPGVRSGQRPGPPLLYAPPPAAPQLENRAPFSAAPLLVSGTDALRRGEYLYQDYLFDDRGANTVPGQGNRSDAGSNLASATAGDVLYPTDPRYAGNAADLVEFRVKPTPDAIIYRVTLNSANAPDAAAIGIGIDTDRSGGAPVAWPRGAGLSSAGLDLFITAWGTGGEVQREPAGSAVALPPGAVSMDLKSRQMTIRVPRSLADPGRATWRYVAGVGLWSGSEFAPVRAAAAPTATEPASGNPLVGAPAIFNLAFRFDEPQTKFPAAPYDTFPGTGNWFEDAQANALRDRTSGPFHADVDFGALADGATRALHDPPGGEQARIYPSSLGLPQGVRGSFPEYGGQLQPYILTVPPGYRPGQRRGLTFALHSLGGTYTQFQVFSPNQLRQFGDDRGNFVLTTLGHGPDGWYTGAAESDFFQAWADVARRFSLDPQRTYLSGYSMGGYGTYKLGVEYPDLFAKAFTTVGPPGLGVWVPPAAPVPGGASTLTEPLLGNVRWLPYLNWAQATDELVPYAGVRAQQAQFVKLGLRSQLSTFTPGEHFTLAVLDAWQSARDYLGSTPVTRDPPRVDYAFFPSADRLDLGLRHDHAYWVSGLRARDASGDPATKPARAELEARSLAFGLGDPTLVPLAPSASASSGPPLPNTIEGQRWGGIPRIARRNTLDLRLSNVRQTAIDAPRARLSARRLLRVVVDSDGPAAVRIAKLALPHGARVTGGRARVDSRGVTLLPRGGHQVFTIRAVAGPRRGARRPPAHPRFTG